MFHFRYAKRQGKEGKVGCLSLLGGALVWKSFVDLSRQPEKKYEIVGALVTTPRSQAIPILDRWRVPWRLNDIHDFYRLRGIKVRDLSLWPDFDRQSVELIADFEPSCIALYGYIYIWTRPILENYPGGILNVHDSDLTIHDKNGRRRYCGLHATRDAIIAGETRTCSSVHLVTEQLDAGPERWPYRALIRSTASLSTRPWSWVRWTQ